MGKKIDGTRMVRISVAQKDGALARLPARAERLDLARQLVSVDRKAGIDEERAFVAEEDPGVRAAGRLNQGALGSAWRRKARRAHRLGVPVSPVALDPFCELAHVVERLERVCACGLEDLDEPVCVHHDPLCLRLREAADLRDVLRERLVEERVVDQVAFAPERQLPAGADPLHLVEEDLETCRILHIEAGAHDLCARQLRLRYKGIQGGAHVVVLRTGIEIGEREAVALAELEEGCQRPLCIGQLELEEDDPTP